MLDIWNQTLEALRQSLSGEFYRELTHSVRCSEVSDERVVLQAPGRVQRDWIVEHYLALIEAELLRQAGRDIEVLVEVAPKAPRVKPARRGRPAPAAVLTAAPSAAPAAPAAPALAAQAAATAPAAALLTPQRPSPAATLPRSPAPQAQVSLSGGSPVAGQLNDRYTFESFVVGNSNQMAHAAALAVCDEPGKVYNPLFLYGGSGLGKTHLLQAVGHAVLRRRPDARVLYRSAEDFMNDFTRSLRMQNMEAFRRSYRDEVDLLLLDDAQFMARKEQTQQEFFHTFEALFQRGAQIVMTCDRLPREIDHLDERLRTRFAWGLLADVQAPGLETRIAIVQRRGELDGFELPRNVALFLAEHFRNNVRELEGALKRLTAYASFQGRSLLTLDFAREVLQEHLPRGVQLGVDDAIRAVAEHFDIRSTDIKGQRRHRSVARPRQIAMYLVRELLEQSYPEIGRAFGRDHTTVLSACRKVEELIESDAGFAQDVEALRRKLREA